MENSSLRLKSLVKKPFLCVGCVSWYLSLSVYLAPCAVHKLANHWKVTCCHQVKQQQGLPAVCSMIQLLYLRNPGMLLLEIGVRGTPKLRRAGLELLALEAISVRSFGRKLLWLPASGKKAVQA